MFPFKHATEEMFNSYFDHLYKLCRFGSYFQEEDIELLEKAMRRNLMKPERLFKMLVPEEREEKVEKMEEEAVEKSSLEDIIEVEDDLEEFNKITKTLAFVPKEYFKGLDLNETKLVEQRIAEAMSANQLVKKAEESDSSESEFQEQFKLAQATRALARKHFKIHIGGLYASSSKKLTRNKTEQTLSMPVLLVKHKDSGEEDILINCSATLSYGDIKTVNTYLKQEEERAKHQRSSINP